MSIYIAHKPETSMRLYEAKINVFECCLHIFRPTADATRSGTSSSSVCRSCDRPWSNLFAPLTTRAACGVQHSLQGEIRDLHSTAHLNLRHIQLLNSVNNNCSPFADRHDRLFTSHSRIGQTMRLFVFAA